MEIRTVLEGNTRNGIPYLIRYPKSDDVEILLEYINEISQEKTFIRLQGEILDLTDEKKYLSDQISKIENNEAVLLLIESEGKIVGCSGIEMKDRTESHEGVFGISISKKIRGEGIGKKFMECVISEAEKNIPKLKLLTLGVFGDNDLALSMYPKMGFVEFGRLPEGSLHNGNYVDHIYMYKKIR